MRSAICDDVNASTAAARVQVTDERRLKDVAALPIKVGLYDFFVRLVTYFWFPFTSAALYLSIRRGSLYYRGDNYDDVNDDLRHRHVVIFDIPLSLFFEFFR